jgi:RNA-directed DNA polymerase
VRKFFAPIDHGILLGILERYMQDEKILGLIRGAVSSFNSGREGVGLPLGNLTSQLLVNIYMNEFDQFVKHKIWARHYIRYADDFVILSPDRGYLEKALVRMEGFLKTRLRLSLHPDKVWIKTLASGVDFLGWVHFPHHRVLRPNTRRKMLRKLVDNPTEASLVSYLGLLKHGNTEKLSLSVKTIINFSQS